MNISIFLKPIENFIPCLNETFKEVCGFGPHRECACQDQACMDQALQELTECIFPQDEYPNASLNTALVHAFPLVLLTLACTIGSYATIKVAHLGKSFFSNPTKSS